MSSTSRFQLVRHHARTALTILLTFSMAFGALPAQALAEGVELLKEDAATTSLPEADATVEEGALGEPLPEAAEQTVEEQVAEGQMDEAVAAEDAVTEAVPTTDDAQAAEAVSEPVDEPQATYEATITGDPVTLDAPQGNDELFDAYAQRLLDEALPGYEEPVQLTAQAQLTGNEARLYDALKAKINQVAAGQLDSTEFVFTASEILEQYSWTAEELGVDAIIVNKQISEEAEQAAVAKLPSLSKVLYALLADCPYDLYWYDKTDGTENKYGVSAEYIDGAYRLSFTNITYCMTVAQEYATAEYGYDASHVQTVQAAVADAQSVVDQTAGLIAYERLAAFKDAICERVTYNDAAAEDESMPYGNPWQLIYVFDGDVSTNVVCEGYAKAFKYLCDLSAIDGIECRLVNGGMDGGTGAGAHMWNVVQMDNGLNYLVDVTNCDAESIGEPDLLFVVIPSSGTVEGAYVFSLPSGEVTYEYGNVTTTNFTTDELTLATEAYSVPKDLAGATVTVESEGLTYTGEAQEPTVTVTLDGATLTAGTDYTVSYVDNVDAGTATVTVTGQEHYKGQATTTFTIAPKQVTVTADSALKTYGNEDPMFDVTYDGLLDGDTVYVTLTRAEGENVGTYDITPAGEAIQGNYAVAYVSGTLTINPAPVTVTVDSLAKAYGDDDPELTATVDGLVGEDTVVYTLSREQGEEPGEYAITATGEATQGNYELTFVAGTLTIGRRAVTVTANSFTKTYGDDDPELTVTIEGLVDGDTIDYTITRAEGENKGTYDITVQGEPTQGNYAVSFVPGTLTVKSRRAIVKADDTSKTYGQPDPEFTATVEGVVGEDKLEFTLWHADGEDVGSHEIKASGMSDQGNYDVLFVSGTMTINPASVTVTPVDARKTYGEADPELTATVEGLVGEDTIEYTVVRDSGEDVGTYTITPKGEETQGNYIVTFEPGSFTIERTAAVVTVVDATKVYGADDPTYTATVTGLVGDDALSYTFARDEGEDVGTYTVKALGSVTQGNYLVVYREGTLTVTPAAATVTADNLSKVYGADDPTFTATVEGLVGDDTLDYRVTCDEGDEVGTYVITPSGEAEQGNYTVTYVEGVFEITPAPVTVTADSLTKAYGEADPQLTVTVTGLVDGDAGLLDYTLTRAEGEDVGTYEVSVTGEAEQGNYLVTYVPGQLTIEPCADKIVVTITGHEAKVLYDGQEHVVEGYDISCADTRYDVAAVTFAGEAKAAQTEHGTTYMGLTADQFTNTNASFSNVVFEVTDGFVTVYTEEDLVDLSNASVTVSGDFNYTGSEQTPEPVVTLDGATLKAGEDYTVSYAGNTSAGIATVTITGTGMYRGTTSGTFTIAPKPVTVTAPTLTKVYGEAVPDQDTLKNESTVEGATNKDIYYAVACLDASDNVGTYTLQPVGEAEQGNYVVTYVSGTLTINPAQVTVTAADATKMYGDEDPEFTATVAGLLHDDTVNYAFVRDEGEDAGTYAIHLQGDELQGNYQVTYVDGTFTITKLDLTQATVATVNNQAYTGKGITPKPAVTLSGVQLTAGEDFTYTYKNNVNVGTGTLTITGKGAYEGSIEVPFTIVARSIASAKAAAIANKTYTGKVQKPAVKLTYNGKTLVAGTDYTVAYKNNTKVGTATITIKGKGNFKSSKTLTFKIVSANISKATASKIANQSYDGTAKKPLPTLKFNGITLKRGTDYTVAYKNNTKIGTATITIKGKGNFTGTKTVTFKIVAMKGTWKSDSNGWWYQYQNGTYPKAQFANIGGARYYFNASGYMVTGWQKVGSYWYFFRSDGKMAAGWMQSGSTWFYLDTAAATAGRMATGFKTIQGSRYYFNASGAMQTGWVKVGTKWYYFNASGVMQKNRWVDGYYLGADGVMQ